MSEIRTFCLGNRTKNGSVIRCLDFGLLGLFGYTINVRNPSKFERSVGQVDQPNVRNPNGSTTEPKQKAPKSERSDFGRSL